MSAKGKNDRVVFSEGNYEKTIKKYALKSGAKTGISAFALRHSFATHPLEQETSLGYIRELLGHSGNKTAERLTHVCGWFLQKITSQLDKILNYNNLK